MNPRLIRSAVRLRLLLTPRPLATRGIRRCLDRYLALASMIDSAAGRRIVRVPAMLGIDADMRDWSFFMILAHNVIVNRYIHGVVGDLSRGRAPQALASIDMKRDVLPPADAGIEQVAALRSSAEAYLAAVAQCPRPWPKTTAPHPLFGPLTARRWHGMFGFHLRIHLRQAERVVALLKRSRSDAAR